MIRVRTNRQKRVYSRVQPLYFIVIMIVELLKTENLCIIFNSLKN